MLTDRYDNPISTTSQTARDAYIDGVDRFFSADAGVVTSLDRAIAEDPGFSLAYLARARQAQMLGDRETVQTCLSNAQANAAGLTEREASHLACFSDLLSGNAAAAYPAIRKHVDAHPRDAMVVQTCIGVFGLIGFSGQPGREAEQLAFTASLLPHYGEDWWFLGGHAFAQVEAGQITPAAETIERSLAGNPRNANSAHYKAHIHYEAGETGAGARYMKDWLKEYPKEGMLHCHIAWHVALWALETGDVDAMWDRIDRDIGPGKTSSPAINVLSDTAAILCRAQLGGVDVPHERWLALSDYATRFFPKPGIAFADVHAAIAHAFAGNADALQKIMAEARGPAGDLVSVLAEAFGAFAAGSWAEASALISRTLYDHARIGGSRAQRDLIEFALLATLLKQGREEEARMLLRTRRPVKAESRPVAGL